MVLGPLQRVPFRSDGAAIFGQSLTSHQPSVLTLHVDHGSVQLSTGIIPFFPHVPRVIRLFRRLYTSNPGQPAPVRSAGLAAQWCTLASTHPAGIRENKGNPFVPFASCPGRKNVYVSRGVQGQGTGVSGFSGILLDLESSVSLLREYLGWMVYWAGRLVSWHQRW